MLENKSASSAITTPIKIDCEPMGSFVCSGRVMLTDEAAFGWLVTE